MTFPIRRPLAGLAALLALGAAPALAQQANLARNLAATCANCHGTPQYPVRCRRSSSAGT